MIGTTISLTSCGSDDKEVVIVEEDRRNYGIVFENDIACIYEITNRYRKNGNSRYYSEISDDQEVVLQGEMLHYLENYTLEEVEEYARIYLSENGQIKYYNVEGKENPKTLTKTK